MRIATSAALALIALAAPPSRAASVKAAPSASKTFEGWTATCDNLLNCIAIGSSDDGDGLFYVRVARGASDPAPRIKVVLATSDPIAGAPGAFQLTVNGKVARTSDTFSVAATKDDPDGAAIAGEIADAYFLTAFGNADALDYSAGTLKGHLASKGLNAALRFIDEQQGRVGTSSALVARGTTPFARMSPAPVPPLVQAAGVVAAAVATPVLSRALLDMAKPACDPEVVEAHSEAAVWSLGPDRRLVAVPCAESPYNVSVALFTTDAKGELPRPAMLEEPPRQGDAEAENVVVNYEFDAKTLTLTSLDKGRGLGDCGAARTWVWTGEIFALLKAAELEVCPGALPEDWPPVYQARRP